VEPEGDDPGEDVDVGAWERLVGEGSRMAWLGEPPILYPSLTRKRVEIAPYRLTM
jgi:hypothetical protein